jgi:putative membrane protein
MKETIMRGQTVLAFGVAAALTMGGVASAQMRGGATQPGQTNPTGQMPASRPSSTASQAGSKVSPSTSTFLKNAADGGMMEVELAKVAEQKASNDQVKSLAQKIEQDHTQANSQLTSLASSKGVTLPTDTSAAHKASIDRLSKLSGAAFDRAYVSEMIKDHQKDIAEFRQHAKDTDTDVQQFVTKTLPALQDHLQRAQSAQSALGSSSSSSKGSSTKPTSGSSTGSGSTGSSGSTSSGSSRPSSGSGR